MDPDDVGGTICGNASDLVWIAIERRRVRIPEHGKLPGDKSGVYDAVRVRHIRSFARASIFGWRFRFVASIIAGDLRRAGAADRAL